MGWAPSDLDAAQFMPGGFLASANRFHRFFPRRNGRSDGYRGSDLDLLEEACACHSPGVERERRIHGAIDFYQENAPCIGRLVPAQDLDAFREGKSPDEISFWATPMRSNAGIFSLSSQ